VLTYEPLYCYKTKYEVEALEATKLVDTGRTWLTTTAPTSARCQRPSPPRSSTRWALLCAHFWYC